MIINLILLIISSIKQENLFSASNFNNNIKTTKHLSNSAIINSTKNKNSEPKQPIKLRLKSGINIKKNNIISTGLYNKIYNTNNRRNRNINVHLVLIQ